MTDHEIISHYGGPTGFANLLVLTASGSVQRVSNWVKRGIPAEVKLQHPHLFGITIGSITQATELADPGATQEGQGVGNA